MKVLFICPSTRFGCCGVADYTRRLAAACMDRGVECAILALNDGEAPTSEASDIVFPVCRLSTERPWNDRVSQALDFVRSFSPDWISLQFVPYGYHAKGYCFSLAKVLRRIGAPIRRHVFFHELTLGLHREETISNRIHGFVQRIALRRVIKAWNPEVIHTHAAPYKAWLRREGLNAHILPLFGNSAIAHPPVAVAPVFERAVLSRRESPETVLLGGYFGTFYPGAGDPLFIGKLRRFAGKSGKQVILFLAGRQDPAARQRWEQLVAASDELVRCVFLGELPDQAVSSYLQQLDFGVAATPFALIGKSGSVAAMRDHGLPIFVPRNDWTPKFPVEEGIVDSNFLLNSSDLAIDPLMFNQPHRFRDSLSVVAGAFVQDLKRPGPLAEDSMR